MKPLQPSKLHLSSPGVYTEKDMLIMFAAGAGGGGSATFERVIKHLDKQKSRNAKARLKRSRA
jgi:hypothetical protein